FFWVHRRPLWNLDAPAYGPEPPAVAGAPAEGWQKIGLAEVDPAGSGPTPTDDWPFLYLKEKRIPSLNLRGMLLITGLSVTMLLAFAPVRTARPNGRMFFLGAGFM